MTTPAGTPALPLWWDGELTTARRPALASGETVDVCIVGAGYTGLWTAYYLLEADPSLSVLVLEAEHVGFGASGRNGGWVSALYPVGPGTLAADHGESMTRTSSRHCARASTRWAGCRRRKPLTAGSTRAGRWLLPVAARRRRGVGSRPRTPSTGAPGRRGSRPQPRPIALLFKDSRAPPSTRTAPASIRSDSPSDSPGPSRTRAPGSTSTPGSPAWASVACRRATVSSSGLTIIRATEAWTARLPGHRRSVAPVYSLVVATAPLPPSIWKQIGLADAQTFSEHRHVIVYGQRTDDDRIVFGGRGAPYHFGSGIKPEFDADATVFRALRRNLNEMLPATEGVEFTHAWGGPLGIARDWHPGVGYNPTTGAGHAGGYVGDGVAPAA